MGTKGPAGLRLSERAYTKGGGEERFMGLVGGSGSRAKDGGGGVSQPGPPVLSALGEPLEKDHVWSIITAGQKTSSTPH